MGVTAVVGSAVVGAVASDRAADKAADAQVEAARNAGDIEREMFYQTRADYEPYRDTGESALNRLAAMYGLGGQAPDYEQFYSSPDYGFALDQGAKAVEQSMARRGLQGSGAEMASLARFGQGLASQQLNNYRNSLASLAGIGQTSTSQLGALGANVAGSLGQGAMAAGDARSSAYLNRGAAIGGATNNIAQYFAARDAGLYGSTASPSSGKYIGSRV